MQRSKNWISCSTAGFLGSPQADPVSDTLHFVMKANEQKLNRTLKSKRQEGNHDR